MKSKGYMRWIHGKKAKSYNVRFYLYKWT
ncbi:hypothetical protein EMIT048CA2_40030 [Pseudomonas chlororaphis]